MHLKNVYDYSLFQKEIKVNCNDFDESEYISDITLYFDGNAYVKIYIDDICIEKSLAKDSYHIKNFRSCAFPLCLYNLRIECDIEYTMKYSHHEHDELIRSIIILRGAYYEFYPNTCGYKYLNMKNGKYIISNQIEKIHAEKYHRSSDEIVVSISCSSETINNDMFHKFRKYIIPSYGLPYHMMLMNESSRNILLDYYTIISKSQVCDFISEIKSVFPDIVIDIHYNISACDILNTNKNNVKRIIHIIKEKQKNRNWNPVREIYDLTGVDIMQ